MKEAALKNIKKVGNMAKNAWLMVGVTVLLLCLLEGSFALFFFFRERFSNSGPGTPGSLVSADAYSDSSWVKSYWAEFTGVRAAWRSYVYWRRQPFQGKYINIDANGIRLTAAAESPRLRSGAVKIAMFGGSTLWGTGVRDAFTIPSIVAKELQKEGIPSEIINFGESGYVSTQGVLTLLLQLQQGNIPDIVIFFDGVNDTYSAYQQRVAGLPQNEFRRVKEFNLLQPEHFERRVRTVFQTEVQRLSTLRFLNALLQRLGVQTKVGSVDSPLPVDNSTSDSESLGREVIRTYMGNIELVKALSEHYHFQYLFYWQPTIFQKINLTEYENLQRRAMQTSEQFFKRTYELMQRSRLSDKSGGHFHDVSLIFSDVHEPVYLDFCHVGESGNERIAKRMAHDVLKIIAAKRMAATKTSG